MYVIRDCGTLEAFEEELRWGVTLLPVLPLLHKSSGPRRRPKSFPETTNHPTVEECKVKEQTLNKHLAKPQSV